MQNKVVLVIPCYNESARLPALLKRLDALPCTLLFVNDGSTDKTGEMLQQRVSSPHSVLSLPENAGKAEAVRQGMLSILDDERYAETEWAGYWDADLATPLEEIPDMLRYAEMFYSGVSAVFGSRIARLGSHIRRNPLRHLSGRLFCTLSSLLLGLDSYDSQCGAKLFRRGAVDIAFGKPFISRWIFDVEIQLRLKHPAMIEYPLKNWTDVRGSTIKISTLAFSLLPDLVRIYLNQKHSQK